MYTPTVPETFSVEIFGAVSSINGTINTTTLSGSPESAYEWFDVPPIFSAGDFIHTSTSGSSSGYCQITVYIKFDT
jgi:hypothetical protein